MNKCTNLNRLVFLNYISRSGSTYLCKILDDYKEIQVGVEAGFPGFTKRLIPKEYKRITDVNQLNSYLNLLYDDIRFKEWNVDRNSLLSNLKQIGYPLSFNDILETLLKLYFKRDREIWLHKAGYYIRCWNELNRLFPNSKSIYLIRDPRAIFNSMKNTKDLYKGKMMGADIIAFTINFKNRVKLIKKYIKCSSFLLVKYENLIKNKDKTIEEVLNFIEIKNTVKENNESYVRKIPNNQKYLHENISNIPLDKNIDKWKLGLGKWETVFIQKVLKNELSYLGYQKYQTELNQSELNVLTKSVRKYYIYLAKNYIYRKIFFRFKN